MTENPEDELKENISTQSIEEKTISLISERLLDLPKEIHTLELALIEQQGELDAVKLRIKNWELSEMQDITSLMTPLEEGKKPKAIYSNESARKAALEQRKDEHDGYGAMEAEHRDLKHSLDKAKADLTYKYNRFSAIRNIAKMVAGILREG